MHFPIIYSYVGDVGALNLRAVNVPSTIVHYDQKEAAHQTIKSTTILQGQKCSKMKTPSFVF